ncbi:MAG: hypothetical protein R3A78_07705 [Polyangiales bacterium]
MKAASAIWVPKRRIDGSGGIQYQRYWLFMVLTSPEHAGAALFRVIEVLEGDGLVV